MPLQEVKSRWQDRLSEIKCSVAPIRFNCHDVEDISQDEESCEVIIDGDARRIRFHDYHELYDVPGLYERLFYKRLECCSPSRVVHLFREVLSDTGDDLQDLRVLDVGAGNGMVGDELFAHHAKSIVGLDILAEAKEAAYRDRPEVYDDYLVTDLTDLPESDEKRLRSLKLDCLTIVAALGFGDIPTAAFLKALDLIDTPGWVVFNIKEDFLSQRDDTGFCRLVRELSREQIFQVQAYQRYRHRLSITGKPLYYVAVVARKLKDVPDSLFTED